MRAKHTLSLLSYVPQGIGITSFYPTIKSVRIEIIKTKNEKN